MKLIFYMQINIKDFFKLILEFLVCVTRRAQITENNQFAFSLQYLKKKVIDEVDFLHADKHESLLQIDTMIFDGDGQTFPKFPKLQCLYNVLKMNLGMKLILYMQINIKVSYKLISIL